MKIPYDEIISKANARKEALQNFEAAVNDVFRLMDQDQEGDAFIGTLAQFSFAAAVLDKEAHDMLPPDAFQPLNEWVYRMKLCLASFTQKAGHHKMTAREALNLLAVD